MTNGKFITTTFDNFLNESWYHGTPDSREVDSSGKFKDITTWVDYVEDPDAYNEYMVEVNNAHKSGDMKKYHELIDGVVKFKKRFSYNKPLFLSDDRTVAKTYATPDRAFDYQNATQKVYNVDYVGKGVKINATGDRFRFIDVDKVKNGFVNAGVPEKNISKLIAMFNYQVSSNGIKTDTIAAIGSWLEFDYIDVIGVLDSYHGGKTKSTVRMVLKPSEVKII